MNIFKSRTVQTLLVDIAINLVSAYTPYIPAKYLIGINVVLPLVAAYFRINPKQVYETK